MPTIPARALARAVRRAPERLAHPLRYRRALEALGRMRFPREYLFVCHGNICRSPYAAAAFARALPGDVAVQVRIASAGFAGADRPTPAEGLRVAARRGIDLSEHRSRLIAAPETPRGGLVLVMNQLQRDGACRLLGRDPEDVLVLGDLDPEPIDTREIRDPWGAEEEVFEASYDRIDRCIAVLARALLARLPAARG